MNKTVILSFIFSIALLTSCKKDKTEPDYEEETTTVASHPYGYFKNHLSYTIIADTVPMQKNYAPTAYFYSDSIVSDLVNVDSVSINKVYLKASNSKLYYSYDPIAETESAWHVKGKDAIPSFDYKYPMPSYASYAQLPDSINLLQGLTISLIDVLNITKGSSITIFDNLGKYIPKEIKPGATSVTFTAAEFAYLHKSKFYLYINLINQQTQRVNGKSFSFDNQLVINKYLYTF